MPLGGDGNDLIVGGRGDDLTFLGAADDIAEDQAGFDAPGFTGDDANETVDVSALCQRVRFFRDVATVVMDLNGVERIDFRAYGGQDTVRVNDLSGTDLREVRIDLGPPGGDSRGQPDTVVVSGTLLGAASIAGGGGRGPSRSRPRRAGDVHGLRRRRQARGQRARGDDVPVGGGLDILNGGAGGNTVVQ